jgi:hypothetical protein
MKKRGKILRDPRTGPGLLMIEGRQYWFSVADLWKSEIPPRPGLDVEAKFDRAGEILAITAVCDSELAREQRPQSTIPPKTTGAAILRKISAKWGISNLFRR